MEKLLFKDITPYHYRSLSHIMLFLLAIAMRERVFSAMVKDMGTVLDLSISTIKRNLKILIDEGLIIRIKRSTYDTTPLHEAYKEGRIKLTLTPRNYLPLVKELKELQGHWYGHS